MVGSCFSALVVFAILVVEEIEQMNSLFQQKQRELVLAVSKVEELTRQLEMLKNGRIDGHHDNQSAVAELDRLYKELQVMPGCGEVGTSFLSGHWHVPGPGRRDWASVTFLSSSWRGWRPWALIPRAARRRFLEAQAGSLRPALEPQRGGLGHSERRRSRTRRVTSHFEKLCNS